MDNAGWVPAGKLVVPDISSSDSATLDHTYQYAIGGNTISTRVNVVGGSFEQTVDI